MSAVGVVNVRGLNKPEQRAGIVYVGRAFAGWPGHPLANPFKPTLGGSRIKPLNKYVDWLASLPDLEAKLLTLWHETRHGERPLGCW